MIASLYELYHSEYFFLTAMDKNAQLISLAIIATFVTEDGAVRMPTERGVSTPFGGGTILSVFEKIALLETCQYLFSVNLFIA